MQIRGTILQTPDANSLQVLEDHVVTVDAGVITDIIPARADGATRETLANDTAEAANDTAEAANDTAEAANDTVETLPDGVVLIPGLVDTHIHASQWPQLGTGLDLPLDEWLFAYTFPLEARYADINFARRTWADMVPRLLSHGTTTAVYYTSVHSAATTALAEACVQHGQRAFVGRVAMDHPEGTPQWYRDANATEALEASARSIDAVRSVSGNNGLVEPIITPRFIPACTDELLTSLGRLADETGVAVQTHCSENQWEHDYVLERHGCTDTHALERFGLLRPRTVLAHATHLTDDDRATIAASGAGVSHCPLSNIYFSERVFAARLALGAGIPVGLGTDIAGGPEPSLLAQCGHAVGSSRLLERSATSSIQRIDIVSAFWMATMGGARMLDLPVGLLAEGNRFDAVAVDLRSVGVDAHGDQTGTVDWSRMFEQLVRRARPADVSAVWVDGRRILVP